MTNQDKLFFESKGIKDFSDNYTMFCLEQGMLISKALKDKDKILEFDKMDNDAQLKSVPGFSNDHSGNTYTQSIKIAIAYLPELLSAKREKKINTILGSNCDC